MTDDDEFITEDLGDGRQRVTGQDIFTGKAITYIEPIPMLGDSLVDLNELVAIHDEFKAVFEDVFEDVFAENRTERLLVLRERFLDWNTAFHIATTTEESDTDTEGGTS